MIAACPVDRHVLTCLFRYDPELLFLAFLALVFLVSLWKFMT